MYGAEFDQELTKLAAENRGVREAFKVLLKRWPDLSYSTVQRRYPASHKKTIKEGRPSKLSLRTVRALKQLFFKSYIPSSKHAVAWLSTELSVNVHRSTVCRTLVKELLRYRKARKLPRITQAQKVKRLVWAKSFPQRLPTAPYLLFSDEKRWNLNGPDHCTKGWDDDAHRKYRTTVKFQGQSVYVWACVGMRYVSKLHFIDSGSCDSDRYIQILKDECAAGAWRSNRVLMQDGATWHTSRKVCEWRQTTGVRIETIPPNSPDLNPIENLWGLLTYRVYLGNRIYKDVAQLKAALCVEWDKIRKDVAARKALLESYADRVERVRAARGAWPRSLLTTAHK